MKNISRRDFLKGTAAGTLSIAAMGILSGCNSSSATKTATETAVEAVAETAAGGGIYTPGTYTASANGIGVVTVTMTFSESAITNIQIDTSNETEGIGRDKGEELAQQLLDAQSAEIDGVSGASVTSDAVKKAAENCIEQAKGLAEASAATVTTAGELTYDEDGFCTMSRAEYFEACKPQIGEITNTEEFDLVVIGAGNGGLVAAASAADLGGKVIVIEKSGSYTTWAGEIGAINSKLEYEKYGVHYTDEEVQEIANDICRYASYGCDQRLVELR